MIAISDIIPTQNAVRDPSKVEKRIKQLEKGRVFRTKNNRVSIFQIKEDQMVQARDVYSLYCHDGHHRLKAMSEVGIQCLYDGEYDMIEMTYKKMGEINRKVGWVTPFDPRTYCRRADLENWKDDISVVWQQRDDAYIMNHPKEYLEERTIYSFKEMQI